VAELFQATGGTVSVYLSRKLARTLCELSGEG